MPRPRDVRTRGHHGGPPDRSETMSDQEKAMSPDEEANAEAQFLDAISHGKDPFKLVIERDEFGAYEIALTDPRHPTRGAYGVGRSLAEARATAEPSFNDSFRPGGRQRRALGRRQERT